MPGNPYFFSRFWRELKRRRVFRVIATYLATAYIIIEVTNNLVGPLQLPGWTATLIIVLLAIGLPVTLILTWFFDFTPEGIKKTVPVAESAEKPAEKGFFKRILSANNIVIAVLVVIVGILAWPGIFGRINPGKTISSKGPVTVAVMPFQNMTNDTLMNEWQDGIQVNLITSLSNSGEIKVSQLELVNRLIRNSGIEDYSSLTNPVAAMVSRKVKANAFVCGSIKEAGSTIRINAQIVNSGTEDLFRSFQLDGVRGNILMMIDSLASLVRSSIIISKLGNEKSLVFHDLIVTNSAEAYRYFSFGNIAFQKYDFPTAVKWLSQACARDTNLIFSSILLALAYANEGSYKEAKNLSLKLYKRRDQLPMPFAPWINYAYALCFQTPADEVRYLREIRETGEKIPLLYSYSGFAFNRLDQFRDAIPDLEKAIELYKKQKTKPFWSKEYNELGLAYHRSGMFENEKKLYRNAEKYFTDDPQLLRRMAILSLAENDSIAANEYLLKFKKALKGNLVPESAVIAQVGDIFSEAGIDGTAESYYRQALSIDQNNPDRLNELAWFLIDKDRNIDEGMQFADRALKSDPANFLYLECKGWGLYKQGKFREAIKLLEKSRGLSPVYRYRTEVLISEVNKAAEARNINP